MCLSPHTVYHYRLTMKHDPLSSDSLRGRFGFQQRFTFKMVPGVIQGPAGWVCIEHPSAEDQIDWQWVLELWLPLLILTILLLPFLPSYLDGLYSYIFLISKNPFNINRIFSELNSALDGRARGILCLGKSFWRSRSSGMGRKVGRLCSIAFFNQMDFWRRDDIR